MNVQAIALRQERPPDVVDDSFPLGRIDQSLPGPSQVMIESMYI